MLWRGWAAQILVYSWKAMLMAPSCKTKIFVECKVLFTGCLRQYLCYSHHMASWYSSGDVKILYTVLQS